MFRDFIARFSFSKTKAEAREQDVQMLAAAIVEYGKMMKEYYPACPQIVVEQDELIFRYRENMETVAAALLLLESKGLATRDTQSPGWVLNTETTDVDLQRPA